MCCFFLFESVHVLSYLYLHLNLLNLMIVSLVVSPPSIRSSSDPEKKLLVQDEKDGTKAKEDAAASTKDKPVAVDEERGDTENPDVEVRV